MQLITVLVYGSSPPKSHGQGYLNFNQKSWNIRLNEFIFRTINFTENYLKWLTLLKNCSWPIKRQCCPHIETSRLICIILPHRSLDVKSNYSKGTWYCHSFLVVIFVLVLIQVTFIWKKVLRDIPFPVCLIFWKFLFSLMWLMSLRKRQWIHEIFQ